VREPDLISWLHSNKNHAALDVYEHEPLPAAHPLRKLENVTLSPHLGYVHEDNYRIFYRDTVENVAAFMAGKPIRVINE
jgi:phosphoglycerate dehydrogenase-like enzyme